MTSTPLDELLARRKKLRAKSLEGDLLNRCTMFIVLQKHDTDMAETKDRIIEVLVEALIGGTDKGGVFWREDALEAANAMAKEALDKK